VSTDARLAAAPRADWFAGYAPLPGVPDELIGPDGAPRPGWRRFFDLLGRQDIDSSIAAADRHIRDMGISYRVHGEAQERSWPLSRLPLLIDETEWRAIAAGVAQRAEVMEAILADLYGEGRLAAQGLLPAAAIAGSPNFLRPMVGVDPPGGRRLRLYAVDLGRGPDGRWWVLGDRTQAPSGAGYALENRMILSRAFPALTRGLNVRRLAPFFRDFRNGLAHAAERAAPRIGLLTPGPFSDTYYEQTYLARYLGFLLVEGDDLVAQDRKLHIRTIAGLKRADVLWRRVDGDYLDPLELDGRSRLGVPGLIDAIRAGTVVVANAPGVEVVESRALLGFLPEIARRLTGDALALPHVATWWCGQEDARRHVLENFEQMAIARAFGAAAAGFDFDQPQIPAEMEPQARAALFEAVKARGMDYVGQEVARLSTAPMWTDGRLEPRPFVLRVFAAATPEGWSIMPGGFCRVSEEPDARAVLMGAKVRSADVWVLSDKPVEMESLLPSSETVEIRRLVGHLPSRAADNLFWYGRYLERCEATIRLVRTLAQRALEQDYASGGLAATLDRLIHLLVSWGAIGRGDAAAKSREALPGPREAARAALSSEEDYGSARELTRRARNAAAVIRERLSVDAWRLLLDLEALADAPPPETLADAYERADAMLRRLAALSGLGHENTNHVAGWRFLDMGRRVERGVNTCRFARVFADDKASADDLDVLLDLVDSQITYRSRYLVGMALAPARDMTLLDPFNPRSVAFQVESLAGHLAALPTLAEDGLLEEPQRLVGRLLADVQATQADDIDARAILSFEQRLMAFADALGARYFLQRPGKGRRIAPAGVG
jgi:uncharacterized circularly permuted ATP-grasp superfamily protein/uncharacterized alpha-E superfamily protein